MEEQYKEAAFNPAIERLRMICRALELCSMGRFNYDVETWYRGLLDLRVQIYPKLRDNEKQEIDKELPELAKLLNQNRNKSTIMMTPEVYKFLDVFEIKLREYQEKHKLGIPDSDFAGEAIER
jgi:hypothetical protein